MPSDLLLISPLFHGDASGAAVYYRLLSEALMAAGKEVAVVSDREKGSFGGRYYGLFPRRCGRRRRPVRDLACYALQNATYAAIPAIVRRQRPQAVLVHSSFYNFPGLFPAVVGRLLRDRPRPRLVADVRDQLMPARRVAELNRFDATVACSENVAAHLLRHGCDPARLLTIPVLQEPLRVDAGESAALTVALGLASRPYVMYAGLVKGQKGVGWLLRCFHEHVRPALPGAALVICGLIKTADKEILGLLKAPGVIYAGNRPRREVLALMAGASLCVNLSSNEGMPRSSLEALALRRPVLLPPGVPEFERFCPDFVAETGATEALAAQMLTVLERGAPAPYPVERHLPERVVPEYLRVLFPA